MAKVLRDGVEYCGVSDHFLDDVQAFNYDIVDRYFEVDKRKAGISKIIKCHAKADITSMQVEKINNIARVDIEIMTRCEYISDDNLNYVFTDRKIMKFPMDIILSDIFEKRKKVASSIFIEDIFVKKLDSRKYMISVSVLSALELINN